jgi:hypothetical protein
LDFQVRRLGRFGINEEASKENIGGYFGGLRRSLHAEDKKGPQWPLLTVVTSVL